MDDTPIKARQPEDQVLFDIFESVGVENVRAMLRLGTLEWDAAKAGEWLELKEAARRDSLLAGKAAGNA